MLAEIYFGFSHKGREVFSSCHFSKPVPSFIFLIATEMSNTTSPMIRWFVLLGTLISSSESFNGISGRRSTVSKLLASTIMSESSTQASDDELLDKYTAIPIQTLIRPSITDKARTITHVCTSGTLSTLSVVDGIEGFPFGSYVDYILDSNGWPVLLLSEQSLHTVNLKKNPNVSLFCQLPRSQSAQTLAALSRVTTSGKIVPVAPEELAALKLAFTLIHPYAEQIVESPKFSFCKIQPEKIYFSGGFGVMATWVDVKEYELARPDVLAQEVPTMLSRINLEKQGELFLMCKHFLGLSDVTLVRIQAIDRLGVDLRVQIGDLTDEYRVAFRNIGNSAEDAKSEVMKLFQESWERENGFYFTTTNPPVTKYAEDILRNKK
eukprot:gene8001-16378_t